MSACSPDASSQLHAAIGKERQIERHRIVVRAPGSGRGCPRPARTVRSRWRVAAGRAARPGSPRSQERSGRGGSYRRPDVLRAAVHAAQAGPAGCARRRRSTVRSPAVRSPGNRRRSPQKVQRAASPGCSQPPVAGRLLRKAPSGWVGIETVVSTPRSAAHFSQRWSCVTAFFTICASFRRCRAPCSRRKASDGTPSPASVATGARLPEEHPVRPRRE